MQAYSSPLLLRSCALPPCLVSFSSHLSNSFYLISHSVWVFFFVFCFLPYLLQATPIAGWFTLHLGSPPFTAHIHTHTHTHTHTYINLCVVRWGRHQLQPCLKSGSRSWFTPPHSWPCHKKRSGNRLPWEQFERTHTHTHTHTHSHLHTA